ncbi:MAG: 4-alpha-glucanotransferase [Litoreibacter sp.]
MSVDHDLAALAELCGILPNYYDLHGNERISTPETQKALLSANGIDVSSDEAIHNSLNEMRNAIDDRWFPEEIIVESGVEASQNFGLGAEWQLRLDEDEAIFAVGEARDHITLPPLPSGVYVLTATASGRTETVTVLATPKRLPTLDTQTGAGRLWGMNLALYGIQSSRNGGIGDFKDLSEVVKIAAAQGASFLGINPLHDMGFNDLEAISPYSPSHRGFLNTAYIALDAIPGMENASVVDHFEATRAAVNIQYRDHKIAHNKLLEIAFVTFNSTVSEAVQSELVQFTANGGEQLQEFANFEALCDIHGNDWRHWPIDLGQPDQNRINFHIWLQWVAASQLALAQLDATGAGMPLGLYLDLAVGPRRDGAESWCEQSAIATGVSIGAPPDHLSPEGQNWDLAAFAPRKLKAQNYAPLRRILAQTMRHAGVIRIDHVLGLNRSFWIPDDGSPGGYIRQNFEALLAIIKIEAERNNCLVIGEDLGLVPEGFRETMQHHGFYGYSVLQYEKDEDGSFQDPSDGPTQVLSCFATHDTPTVKGYEIGRDIDWWERLAWVDATTAQNMRGQRSEEVIAFKQEADFQARVHNHLGQTNAALVAVQLDDILDVAEAHNLPGTIDQHPNWRRKYNVFLEDLPGDPRMTAISHVMHEAGRKSPAKGAFK